MTPTNRCLAQSLGNEDRSIQLRDGRTQARVVALQYRRFPSRSFISASPALMFLLSAYRYPFQAAILALHFTELFVDVTTGNVRSVPSSLKVQPLPIHSLWVRNLGTGCTIKSSISPLQLTRQRMHKERPNEGSQPPLQASVLRFLANQDMELQTCTHEYYC